jgi:3'-phosphoadenosine 5'-phosphosulfate sulfotransferase (PAPS reductase)/FAD synthetase
MKLANYIQPKITQAETIIEEAVKRFKKIGLAFSGGSDSVAILSLTLPFKWDIPVLFVNTNYQFPETYGEVVEYIIRKVKELGN